MLVELLVEFPHRLRCCLRYEAGLRLECFVEPLRMSLPAYNSLVALSMRQDSLPHPFQLRREKNGSYIAIEICNSIVRATHDQSSPELLLNCQSAFLRRRR